MKLTENVRCIEKITKSRRAAMTGAILISLFLIVSRGGAENRGVATTAPGNPGNVFLVDQEVILDAPAGVAWRSFDDRNHEKASGKLLADGNNLTASLGQPGIGWYKIEFLDENGSCLAWTTAAVLARPLVPVPEDSPVCLDAAISWLADDAHIRSHLAGLAALAGVSWIRDRIHWREVQTDPDTFASQTKYDEAARLQAEAGMKVLQVFHSLPKWVVDDAPDRDPRCPDLRHVYRFCRAMAGRFAGSVSAWEPWNEGNAKSFGGWPIDALCSFQKAAFLGFKAGHSPVIVGWNPLGGINTPSLAQGILANETWPYYDTYNIHSYDWPHAYETLWAPAREAACGRPIWVTECDRGLEAAEDSEAGDFSEEYDLRKAELIAQEYATSLYAGAARHFHFILGHYMERRIQFGLLRHDLSPRRSYAALAAVGRFLAGASCLGRWNVPEEPDAWVIVFRAQPDGVERDVIVAWAEEPVDWPQRGRAKAAWCLPEDIPIEAGFDYLGRPLDTIPPLELGSAPVFLLLPSGAAKDLPLSMPAASPYREDTPSPIVLQLQWPEARIVMHKEEWTEEHDYHIPPDTETELRIYAYNFSDDAAKGWIGMSTLPSGWRLTPDRVPLEIEAMGRTLVTLRLFPESGAGPEPAVEWLHLGGDFAEKGRPALAFRIRIDE
jgi:hypothetical protein